MSKPKQAVLEEKGAIHVPLYKALLFIKVALAIKGGVINLRHSYKYRSLDDYLIPKQDWEAQKVKTNPTLFGCLSWACGPDGKR